MPPTYQMTDRQLSDAQEYVDWMRGAWKEDYPQSAGDKGLAAALLECAERIAAVMPTSLPVEEEGAVTEEWLRSLGGEEHGSFGLAFQVPTEHSPSRVLLVCGDLSNAHDCLWDIVNEHEDGTTDAAMFREQLPTQSDVLKIFAALNITPQVERKGT